MGDPNLIKRDAPVTVIKDGVLYRYPDAYDGAAEYFEERPLPGDPTSTTPQDPETSTSDACESTATDEASE
jgi:hypothetical protein